MRVVMLWYVVSRTLVGGGDRWCCPSVVEHGRGLFGIGGGQAWIPEFGGRGADWVFCLYGENL